MLRRILTILAIVASVGVIALSHTKLREHIQGIIDQRETEKTRANKAEGTLKTTSATLKTTSNTLVSVSANLMSTSNELVSTKSGLETAASARDKAVQERDEAREKVKSSQQEMARWDALGVKPEAVKAMQDELGKSSNAVVVLQEETRMLVRRVARLTNELNKYIDPENYEVKMAVGLKGNVLVVDPKWQFVVLDIGEKQGAVVDGIMLVHRDSKLVGKVKITRLLPDRSIANVMPGWKLDDLREGDKVLF
jgi:hypothetical protein